MVYDNTRLITLLKRDALRTDGPYTLSSGKTSSYYVDVRQVTLTTEGIDIIVDRIFDIISHRLEITAIGGPVVGADPIIGAVLGMTVERDFRGFLVRPEVKHHGAGGRIVGPLRAGDVVTIVDDVATSGGSLLSAVDAVEAIGCRVAVVVVVLDRLEGTRAAVEARGIPFISLATIGDLGIEPEVRNETRKPSMATLAAMMIPNPDETLP